MTDYPHACPSCGSPAYVGLSKVECSRVGCQWGPKLGHVRDGYNAPRLRPQYLNGDQPGLEQSKYASVFFGHEEPTYLVKPGLYWQDRTTGLLKQRNATNTEWIVVATGTG